MSYNGQVSLEKERCTELGEQLNKQLSREIALEADDTFKSTLYSDLIKDT